MKKNKALILIPLAVVLSITILGCQGNAYQKSIYNSDSRIAKDGDSFTFLVSKENTTNEESNLEFKGFDGDETIWTINAKEEGTVHIKFKSEIKSGKFKVVLISPDNKVTNIFEEGKDYKDEVKVKKGKNRIKIVGSNAKGSIDMSLKADKNISVESWSKFDK